MRISERIYNRLLGLYPAAFLRDYREPMQQAFRDHLRGAGTLKRVIQLWLRTLVDLGRSLPAAWFRARPGISRPAFENWHPRTREAVFFAKATRGQGQSITPEDLLAGLLTADTRLAARLFPNDSLSGIAAAATELGKGPTDLWLRSYWREVLGLARSEMRSRGRNKFEPGHVVLAILNGPDTPAARFLRSRGVDEAKVRAALRG